jgi:mannose/fructose-specific phosphotransferase system component IIA
MTAVAAEPTMINLLVITHGEFGAYLVEAAEGIVGAQGAGVRCVGISPRMAVNEVRERIETAIRDLNTADGLVILTDMPGGTPCNVAMPLSRNLAGVSVVSGINLYMLVTAFNHRKSASMEELIDKILSAGRRAIVDIKSKFMAAG